MVVGSYTVLQFYGFDPFSVGPAGPGVASRIGNPIFAGVFLLMSAPVILTLALKSNGYSVPPVRTIWWVIPLTLLFLGMAFTQARVPWIGLAVGLVVFLVLTGMVVGWRSLLSAFAMAVSAITVTWTIVTFVPSAGGKVGLVPRAVSAGRSVVSTLAAELSDIEAPTDSPASSTV